MNSVGQHRRQGGTGQQPPLAIARLDSKQNESVPFGLDSPAPRLDTGHFRPDFQSLHGAINEQPEE
jgi:hypothetical protein